MSLQEEDREMKYRRYYQRVLKDRLTALRKVRYTATCQVCGAWENSCGISAQDGTRTLVAFLECVGCRCSSPAPGRTAARGFPTLKLLYMSTEN